MGRFETFKELKKKHIYLILISNDASDKIKKELSKAGVTIYQFSDKVRLGQILGRKEVAVIGVKCQQFTKNIKNNLPESLKVIF